jgi:hypothetical protein
MNKNLLNDLAEYVGVLSASLEGTRRAEDRSAYVSHLSASALIFQSLVKSDMPTARERLMAEQEAYGRSYLDGNEGKAAEAAFARFVESFRKWEPS